MVRKSTGCSHRLEAHHEIGGAPVPRRGSRSVPGTSGEVVDVCAMIGAAIIGVAIGLAIVAYINVALEGYAPVVLIYCWLWCFLVALCGWFLVRGGAA